ncbi:MAG TPA: PIN domain-containing protein [Microbacterium sp.]|nr:PIN domain-containing protein [Microbacterium sp.]
MTAFLDTDVLVYAFDRSDDRKRRLAIEVIERAPFVVSAQVLGEFYVTVTRKLAVPLPADDAARAVGRLSALAVVPTDAALVAAAVETVRAHQVSYWDALIIEAAAVAGCDVLLSEDLADGSVMRGVRIENPFV